MNFGLTAVSCYLEYILQTFFTEKNFLALVDFNSFVMKTLKIIKNTEQPSTLLSRPKYQQFERKFAISFSSFRVLKYGPFLILPLYTSL